MKKLITICLALMTAVPTLAQTPVYLDESKPIEQRIDDAISRMTLDEKIAVIHAQSKFSSPGVKRLGFPDLWTDDGPHGVRPDVLWDEWVQAGQTWLPRGIPLWPVSTARAWARRRSTETRV